MRTTRPLVILASLCVAALAQGANLRPTPTDELTDRLRDLCVTNYRVKTEGRGIKADLHDSEGRTVAVVFARHDVTDRLILTWQGSDGDTFDITFSTSARKAVLTTKDGVQFVRSINLAGNIYETKDTTRAFAERHAQIAAMTALAHSSELLRKRICLL